MIYIFDASALLAYLRAEPGGEFVHDPLKNPAHACFVHAMNLCEVYYDFYRSQGEAAASAVVDEFLQLGLILRSDLSREFWQSVGAVKAIQRRVSLADCFAITLSQILGGSVLTCDHHEFDSVVAKQLCHVTFIR